MSRWTLVVAGVLVWGGLSARPALAQRVSFSIGGHGHGHHHHHHGWHAHYGWDPYPWYPSYWYRPPVYVVPPAVTYVEPAPTVIVREVPPVSSAPAPRTAASTPTVATRPAPANALPSGPAVTIRNPRNSGAAVAFVVDGNTEVELAPGESKLLAEGQRHTIEFDRGGDFGTAERQLKGGSYDFVVTDNGWDLNEAPGRELRSALVPSTPKKNTLPRR